MENYNIILTTILMKILIYNGFYAIELENKLKYTFVTFGLSGDRQLMNSCGFQEFG